MMRCLLLTFVAFVAFSCCNNGDNPIPPVAKERTVLIYMVADNSLSRFAEPNIVAMINTYDSLYGTRLLLFYNKLGGDCTLYDIEKGKKGVANLTALKKYPKGTDPCATATLQTVIADMRALAPAKEWYSMILWSHGSGWLPKGMHPARSSVASGITKMAFDQNDSQSGSQSGNQDSNGGDWPASYSFGDGQYSNSTTFEMNEFADALPSDMTFEYIAFDACYMASVEVAYELRGKTKYFIASAAEVLGAGFPYDKAMGSILRGDAKGIAKDFYDYYNAQSGPYRSATVGVVDCYKLDAVAAEVKALTAMPVILQGGQEFGRNLGSSANYSHLLYDLTNLVHKSWGLTPAFDRAMANAVVYQASTPMLFQDDYYGDITVNTHCGLTVYLPRLSQPKTLAIYKKDYKWALDSNLGALAR